MRVGTIFRGLFQDRIQPFSEPFSYSWFNRVNEMIWKMNISSPKRGQCHRRHSAVLFSAEEPQLIVTSEDITKTGTLAYYAALSFSTKKLASQIRHVLNKRVVGRWGRVVCGRRAGVVREALGLARRRPGNARYWSARLPRSIPRPAPRRPPHARPWFCRSTAATTGVGGVATPYKYLLHFALHTTRVVIQWRNCTECYTSSNTWETDF